jgi:myo-inositol 2-dehydrogenase/D-chiro-inositol 1-dehydrogenase
MTRYTAAYTAEIAAFVEALAGGTPPPTTGRDGLMALVLAEAAIDSVAEERTVRVAEIFS